MSTFAPTVTGDYTIDSTHSRIGFVARHAMVTKVRGEFGEYTGTLHIDAADPARSSAQLEIAVESIDTRNADRDAHLRANDFFDAPTFPKITYAATGFEYVDDEIVRMNGDMTIKGVTLPVTVDWEYGGTAVDPYGNTRVGFEGKAVINRRDFGVEFDARLDAGGVLVSDKITLELEVSAIRA